jgi:hypothetical protein
MIDVFPNKCNPLDRVKPLPADLPNPLNSIVRIITLRYLSYLSIRPWRHGDAGIDRPILISMLDGEVSGQLHVLAALSPGTHWIEGWAGLRSCLDTVDKRKSSVPVKNWTLTVQPVAVAVLSELAQLLHIICACWFLSGKWGGRGLFLWD